MDTNQLIDLLAARLAALSTPATNDALWEMVEKEYLLVTGTHLNRADPYHIMIASEAISTVEEAQKIHGAGTKK